jgi:hypothetical protein
MEAAMSGSEISRQFEATGKLPDRQIPVYTGENESSWVGWIAFASTVLILLGSFHIIQGLVALFRDEVFVVSKRGLVLNVDYTAWGWFHIVMGTLAILVGASLLAGRMWARIFGVIFAMFSALSNLAFLPAYPIWSAMMIVFDVVVIWAITVHGAELKHPPGWDGKDL